MTNSTFSLIRGIGTDIIEIRRIKNAFDRHGTKFLKKIFTPAEEDYCLSLKNPYPSFAARFAAKEAVTKSLGTGINRNISWRDIEINKDKLGKPIVNLAPHLLKLYGHGHFLLSISHCENYATATVIFFN